MPWQTIVRKIRRVAEFEGDRRAGALRRAEIVADILWRRVFRVGFIGADMDEDLVGEEDLGLAGPARRREGREIADLEDIDRAAADGVRLEIAVERRVQERIVAPGAADLDIDAAVGELLLVGEDRQAPLLLAVDLLHRRVVADETGGIAVAVRSTIAKCTVPPSIPASVFISKSRPPKTWPA